MVFIRTTQNKLLFSIFTKTSLKTGSSPSKFDTNTRVNRYCHLKIKENRT